MKSFLLANMFLFALLCCNNANGQANVLDPNDPDVIFTTTNQPPVPAWGVISKWGHRNRLSWNPYSYGYKSYYFKGMAFRVKFPKTYQHNVADGKVYPSILFLHGLGEPGTIWDNEFHLVHGGQTHAQKINDGTFDGFMIYPQSQSGPLQSYFPILKDLVDSMVKYVKLDIDRFHVGGLSSGGQATFDFPQQQQYAKIACALEPISAAQYEDVNFFASHITIPIFLANGGQDNAPYPETVNDIISSYKNLGGNIMQAFFPEQGHGAWNAFWADARYWPFINAQHKANPLVYFQHDKFCPNEPVNAKLGLQQGFAAYEWQKDGVTIPGQTTNELTVTQYGTYRGRFKRTSSGAWSQWSPTPAVISQNQGTVSPAIQINGMKSNVLPAPDGSTTTPLFVPNVYASYEWRRVSDNVLVSSTNTFNAPIGQYKVKVTEQFGCGSDFSSIYSVIAANGANGPDMATSLAAIALTNNSIQLDWNDKPNPSFNETSFEIYRSKTPGSGYTLVGRSNADVLTYLDQGLNANTKYYYIVRAINNNGAAPSSSEVNATTFSDVTAPTAPGNLVITTSTRSSISLSWDFSTDDVGVAKYEIYVDGVKKYVTTNTNFTVNNLTALQSYGFYVRALDASGNQSPASVQVTGFAALRGLTYKYYEGSWSVLPDFNALQPVSVGLTPNVSLSPRLRNDDFGFLWEGYIIIPVSGSYTFETNSDDGSKLYIGPYSHTAIPLVNNDGLHGGQFREGTITLTAGIHPIAITFFERSGGEGMNIYWKSAAAGMTTRTIIPNSAFVDNISVSPGLLPAKPANLIVSATSYNKVNLSWADSSTNESAFEITRSTELLGTYSIIGTTPANITSFIDSVGLTPDTKYWYKVRAINQYGQSELISILESKWSFNNSYSDGSGNNKNLTGSGTPTFNNTDKKEGSHAISLNGINQYADMTFSTNRLFPSNSYTTRTVGIWIKPTSTTINGTNKIVYELGGSDNGLALRFNSGSLQAGIASANVRYTAVANTVTNNPAWVVNGWNHVAVVYNVNRLQLYLNAVLVASTNLAFSSIGTSTSSSRIGYTVSNNAFNSSATSAYYSGLIDDMVILKEPINSGGVLTLLNQSYTSDTTFILPAAPAIPTNLIATAITSTEITLEFADNSLNETSFEIYRSVGNANNFRILAIINAGSGSTKSYVDNNLFSNTDYYYKVRAKGIGGTTAFTSNLLVRTSNNPPLISTIGNFTMRYNSQKTIELTATDLDQETLSFSFQNPLPSFATFTNNSNGSGTLQFNPTQNQLGVYPIVAIVSDVNGGKDTTQFNVTVNDNYTPVIGSISNMNVAEGSTSSLSVTATDQDGNSTLTWSISNAPAFVTLNDIGNGQATLNFAPGYANAGVYNINLTVNDGAGAFENQALLLTVSNVEPPTEKWLLSMKYTSPNALAPWNNISTTNTNSLLNTNGQVTNVGIQFLNTNWNAGDAGAVTGNNSGVYPDAVIKDYFWFGVYGAPNVVDFNLKGLTLGAKYNVTLFGSSAWRGLGNNGTTVYTINGVSKPLYVDNNSTNTVTFVAVTPNAAGNITVTMSKGLNTPYGVINAVVLEKPFDDGTVPVLPLNLTAQALSNGTVKLAWSDLAYNESNYKVYRATSAGGAFTLINPDASNANDSTYIDNTVLSATTYYYKIEATNSAGTSGFTNTVSVSTLNKAPLLADIADVYVKAGNSQIVNFAGTDDVNDILTTSISGLPSFGVYQSTGNGTGNLTFTPSVDDMGIYTGITVKITDNSGASVSKSFNVTVTDNSVRSVYLNFGPDGSPAQAQPWNNFIGYPLSNYNYTNVKDDANVLTTFGFKFLDQWNGGLSVGLRTGDNSGVFPDNVMRTSFHNYNTGNHVMEFTGLNPTRRYSIGFLTNTNTGTASLVTFTNGVQTVSVDGKYNTSVLANLNGLIPNASGIIQVTINKPSTNAILCLNGVVIREHDAAAPVIRPADLFAETFLQKDKIRLTWSDRSSNETGFQIWRSTSSSGNFSLVATTAANITAFTNIDLTPNTRYYYKVRAIRDLETSNYTNVATAILASDIVLINQNVDIAQKAPLPWNSTSSPSTVGATFSNLINTNLLNSGFEMVITKDFNGAGFAGVNTDGIFPANVMVSNYWTDAGQTSQVKFQNLDLSKKYRIGCFGSNNTVNFTTAIYSCNNKSVELNSYFNNSKVVYLDKLTPGADGELIVNVNTAGGSPYCFTGAFTIEYYDDNTPDEPVVNTIFQQTPLPLARNMQQDNLVATATTVKEAKPIAENLITNQQFVENIKVFPNPFTNKIQVEMENLKSASVAIMLYDLSGRQVFRSNGMNVMKGNNTIAANLPVGLKLMPGSYFINILIDGKLSKSVKLIKVN
jgi:large repetitive protein